MANVFEIDMDEDCEMICIKLNGEVIFEGNDWDFNTHQTLPYILEKVATVKEGSYTYG